ncbi:MAG TPA: radical SAM protein, partial [Spirochaetes bacterium]|nr:radical SAM protein [Spirochaetota bacterium]
MKNEFECGPIRPPSEAMSILLRVTRNCPWNRCAFCMTYKDRKFSRRSVEEVKNDIDAMRALADSLLDASSALGLNGAMSEEVVEKVISPHNGPNHLSRQMAFWLHYGLKTAFLQDADSLVMKTGDLCEILVYFRQKFPSLERITTYARASTVAKKSLEDLRRLREAGLTRLHIGMESGCDTVLGMIKKGVTAAEQIDAGRKAVLAGFDLSEYYMPGLGGREHSRENALETARVINSVNPTFVRLRSTVPLPGSPLHVLMEEGSWTPLTEDEKVKEIRLFLEHLEGISSTVLSDHMMNLLEDVEGVLPGDRNAMIELVDRYLGMGEEDRESFIVGRRLGRFRYLSDYHHDA